MLKKINGSLAVLTSIVTLSFLFLFASFIPNVYEAFQTDKLPQNRVMIWGEHIYTYDYNTYLSKIRQGVEGRWTIVDKYNNNPDQKGVFLHMLYLLLGKIGGVFNFSPTLIFHLARVIFSFFLVLIIIFLNIYFLKKEAVYLVGVILSLLSSSFPAFFKLDGHFWVGHYMSWWQEMDVLKRVSYLPHYTLNYIIVSALILLLSKFSKTNDKRYFFIIAIVLFFSFFIHPSGGAVFLLTWLIFYLLKFSFGGFSKRGLLRFFYYTVILVLISLIPLFYIKSATDQYPWKSIVEFDRQHPLPFNFKDYIFALGPLFFTGVIAMVYALLKKEKTEFFPLVSWILGAFLGMAIFSIFFLYQSPVRFVQTANHIPLAILSAYLFGEILTSKNNTFLKVTLYLTIFLIVGNGILQSYYSIKSQNHFIHQRAVAVLPLVPYPPQVMYPLTDFYSALKWLDTNTPDSSVVLSQITAGNYIPAYSGNFVYLGHIPESPHYEKRILEVARFFSGSLSDENAYQFLSENNIDYVFYGPQEKEKTLESLDRYDFLKSVFQTPMVAVYQVKK